MSSENIKPFIDKNKWKIRFVPYYTSETGIEIKFPNAKGIITFESEEATELLADMVKATLERYKTSFPHDVKPLLTEKQIVARFLEVIERARHYFEKG